MGSIADDIEVGKQCSECGVMFEKEHGYPVVCTDCFNGYLDNQDVPDLPRAKIVEL